MKLTFFFWISCLRWYGISRTKKQPKKKGLFSFKDQQFFLRKTGVQLHCIRNFPVLIPTQSDATNTLFHKIKQLHFLSWKWSMFCFKQIHNIVFPFHNPPPPFSRSDWTGSFLDMLSDDSWITDHVCFVMQMFTGKHMAHNNVRHTQSYEGLGSDV